MALKDRIVEIAYRLKDDFSAKVSGVTRSFKKVDGAAEKSSKKVGLLPGAFDRAGRSAQVAGKKIKATLVGALLSVVAAIGRAVYGFGTFREELDATAKAARSIGESVENMTALQYAAELSGLAVQQLRLGMQYMTRVTSEAARNTGGAVKAFEELGLSAEEVNRVNPEKKLRLIAEALQDIDNQADRVRLAVMLFGSENARGFINLMNDGADGIKRMTDAAKSIGNVYNEAEAAKIENYNDKLATINNTIGGMTKRLKLFWADWQLQAFDEFGLISDKGKTELELVEKRMDAIVARTKELKESGSDFRLFGPSVSEELQQLRRDYEKAVKLRENLLAGERIRKFEAQDRAAEREHNRKMAAIRNEGTEALKKTLAERRKEYQKNIADLARLKNEEKAIAKEFSAFVAEIQSGPGASGTPDLIDTSKARLDAQTALNAGDYDTAIEKARQAADMLRQMKEAGAESNIVLTGLAKQIERIANESAQGKVNAKQGLIAEQKKQIDEVAKAIENLPKAKITIDEQSLRAELQRLQQLLNQRPLEVPVKPRESVAGWNSDIRSMADALQRSQWSDL